MSIEDRNLKPGTVLVGRYHKKEHRCEVRAGDGDKLVYRLKDGREFTSPSAAGTAVMDGVACNGWRFWTVEGTEPARKAATARTTAKKAATKAKPVGKGKAVAKAKAKARKPATNGAGSKTRRKVTGGSNGASPTKAIGCGTCGQEFPDAVAATEHIQKEHGAPEAAGSGGR